MELFESINIIAVLVATIIALAIGSIWYSPLLFGSAWLRAAGLSSDNLEMSQAEIVRVVGRGLIVNLLLFLALGACVALAEQHGFSTWLLSTLISLILFASLCNVVVWEKRTFLYVCIHFGYALTIIFTGVGIISYWPW